MTEVFISAETENDGKYAKIVKFKLEKTFSFKAHLIVRDSHPNELLTSLIKKSITGSKYFIPLLTQYSIKNQWVNQEIGFAVATDKVICPIISNFVLHSLSGFISLTHKREHVYGLPPNENELMYPADTDIKVMNRMYNLREKKRLNNFNDCIDLFVQYLIDLDSPIYADETKGVDLKGAKMYLHAGRAVLIHKNKWHYIHDQHTFDSMIILHNIPFDKKTKLNEDKYEKGKEIHNIRSKPQPPVKNPFDI